MDSDGLIPTNNLYEIPNCSICLCEMTEELSSLACGHIFHINCITQHFEYKGTCPYCQKRSQVKEIRPVVFPVTKNNDTEQFLNHLLSNIDKSEGQQVQNLLREIKTLSERSQKFGNDLIEANKEFKKKNEENEKNKKLHEEKNAEVNYLKKENILQAKEINEIKQSYERLNLDFIELRVHYDDVMTQRKEMENFKCLQKVASDNSEELVKYKNELETAQTSPDVMAKRFFDMLQLKNLTILKMKEKQKEFIEKYRVKEEENYKIKNQIQILKKELESTTSEIAKWKTKTDNIKDKYRELVEKYKSQSRENANGGEDIEENSLSISLGLGNKIGFKSQTIMSTEPKEKNERLMNFSVVEKPKIPQPRLSFGNSALKKSSDMEKKTVNLKNFLN